MVFSLHAQKRQQAYTSEAWKKLIKTAVGKIENVYKNGNMYYGYIRLELSTG